MQNMLTKLIVVGVVVGVVLALSVVALFFVRAGEDRGGVSLVYAVEMPADAADPQALLERTISVLEERVDPQGYYDISMKPLGRDRIEIVMPLPSAEVRALARSYHEARDALLERSQIPAEVLDDALGRGMAPNVLAREATTELDIRKAMELQEAYDAYQNRRGPFDDPEDVIRLVRGAGVLDFRIAVTAEHPEIDADKLRDELSKAGPENTSSAPARWFPINDLRQWYETPADLASLEADPAAYFARARGLVAAESDGVYYLLLYTMPHQSITRENGQPWAVTSAFRGTDNLGRPAVNFGLDANGGGLLGRLTGGHVNEPMAIVLDGEVYSAPIIRSTITTNGQITGNYSQAEITYLIRVLAAGSLPVRLSAEPVSVNVREPSSGYVENN